MGGVRDVETAIDNMCEEEILVYVDLERCPGAEALDPAAFKIIGVDAEEPVVQVGDRTFVGRHEDRFGTLMFFEDDPDPPKRDELFDDPVDAPVAYSCSTRKAIVCEEAYLKPKKEDGPPEPEEIPESVARTPEEAIERLRAHIDMFPIDEKPPNVSKNEEDSS